MAKKTTPTNLSALLESMKRRQMPPGYVADENLQRELAARAPPKKDLITEKNIEEVETETIQIASRAIYVLEDALAKWDSLKEKPGELVSEFENCRGFHDALAEWEQRILRSRAQGERLGFQSRVERLMEYARICAAHR